LPASVLKTVEPPALAPAGPRRGVLLAAVLGGLVLLTGSTALALHLAARADRKGDDSTALVPDTDPGPPGDSATPPAEPPRTPTAEPAPADEPADDPVRPRVDVRPRPADPPREMPSPSRPAADHGGLPRDLQEMVNKAIDHGVEYLKGKQLVNGAWENHHTTGLAALPGLTLLECGVPASDPRVQKAARFVRGHAARLASGKETYELSLALLFLDRLGDPKDKTLIRTIALRLVAGQLPEGGWTYHLPVLQPEDERKLLRFLTQTRPAGRPLGPFMTQPGSGQPGPPDLFVQVPGGTSQGSKPGQATGGSTKPIDPGPTKVEPKKPPLPPAEAKKAIDALPPRLRKIPAVVDATGKGSPGNPLVGGRADNSNTQFATLALWAAGRHGLPLERSLDLLVRRFRHSQLPDGTWRYHVDPRSQATPAMTGAGLLGLAVGHGLDADPSRKKSVKDEQVDKGLKALGAWVGKPFGDKAARLVKRGPRGKIIRVGRPRSPVNLYFLWTVERVGVLYHVREMDGKDWYRWGVELLLPAQEDEGSWNQGNYWGANRTIDTCFALLFLKRANLAADLTGRLDFVVEGKPASR
jgi:hypothetical protein